MTRAAHSWYLRNTYRENNLVKPGRITLKGEPLDLGRIRRTRYAVGAEKDHIVPWDAAWRITQLFGGDVRFVLASSGHIAGIINPPGGKGDYWTREIKDADASSPEQWLQSATKHEGSWWPDWAAWLAARSGEKGRRRRWAARSTRRWRMRRERTCWRSSRCDCSRRSDGGNAITAGRVVTSTVIPPKQHGAPRSLVTLSMRSRPSAATARFRPHWRRWGWARPI